VYLLGSESSTVLTFSNQSVLGFSVQCDDGQLICGQMSLIAALGGDHFVQL
jgi:hypothetical protein